MFELWISDRILTFFVVLFDCSENKKKSQMKSQSVSSMIMQCMFYYYVK